MSEHEIEIKLPGRSYRVLTAAGSLDRAGAALGAVIPPGKALLVSDTRVYSLYGERCLCSLVAGGWQPAVALIRPGERAKSLAGAARLYEAAIEAGLDRGSPIIALGGGVTGDLAGFAAATYLRGVPLVMIPTTLLAQVDSSVGGKVAVNHPRGKNLIGSFHQPHLVIADPAVLATLPLRQLKNGLAEVVKYGMVNDALFFAWLEQNLERAMARDEAILAAAIRRSIEIKAAVVELDERESGYRRILNFGHTIGHALEAAAGFGYYLHGEAVNIGALLAVHLARLLGILEAAAADRLAELPRRLGLKQPPAGMTAAAVLEKLNLDKKRRGGELIFVLPSAVGQAVFQPVADRTLLEKLIGDYLAGRSL
ncbi:MAG: 3-dehydroquinate synthase [Firmicutes bacterium]|nr:3-dehydroquinate synthase [Bacillota bacterium]